MNKLLIKFIASELLYEKNRLSMVLKKKNCPHSHKLVVRNVSHFTVRIETGQTFCLMTYSTFLYACAMYGRFSQQNGENMLLFGYISGIWI